MSYTHLTLLEREMILKFATQGLSICQISKRINRNKSTISRELKRNSRNGEYYPCIAQEQYRQRREKCRPHKKLEDKELYNYVKRRFLEDQWSPEEIQGRLLHEGAKKTISCVTIYRAIYEGAFNPPGLSHGSRGAVRKLRHRGKSRHTKSYVERRGKIQISHDIEERPAEAATRSRIGDWEADTVSGVTGKACIVTLVDRKSRFLIGGKAALKKANEVNSVMIAALSGEKVETITPDRGKEFAKHRLVTEVLGVQFYFPKPHHPWQRGTNENTNGLLREYFPKGKDITDIPDEYIREVINKLNMRPRKCLGYKTPYEVYYSTMLHLT